MAEAINIAMVAEDTAGAVPAAYLGGADAFNAFRDACSKGGARWDASATVPGAARRGANVTTIDTIPRLVASLEGAGFTVTLAESVRAVMISRAAALSAVRHGASRATAEMNARLAPRGLTLYPFQGEGVAWLRADPVRLLADDMGLGKTIQGLTAADMIGEDGAPVPVLVICPAVAKGVWSREVKKWRPDLAVTVIEGRDAFRFPRAGEMVSVNYDILMDLHPPMAGETVTALPGTICILDEAQAVKNPDTDKGRRVAMIRDAVLAANGRMWAFTATPFENCGAEVMGIAAAIGAADVVKGMKGTLARPKSGAAFANWMAREKPAAFAGMLAPIMLRREKRTVLPELPAKSRQVELVDIEASAAAELDTLIAGAGGLDALMGRARAAAVEASATADDAPEFETMARARRVLATAKIPALMAIIEAFHDDTAGETHGGAFAGEGIIVMSDHREPIDALAKLPGWGRISGDETARKRTATEDAFQAGKLRGVACTIRAAGVALTLTRARLMIFVDRAWNPSKNDQAEDRIHRIGQMRGVVILRLVARHALDERVAEVCDAKERVREQAVNVLSVGASVAPVADAETAMQALATRPAPVAPVAPAVTVAPAAARPSFVPAGARLFPSNRMRARCVVCGLMIEKGDGMSWVLNGAWASAHREGDDRCVPPLVVVKANGERMEAPASVSRAFRGGNAGGSPGARAHKDVARRGPATPREEWAARALPLLAALDPDRARLQNEVGFSAGDGPAGHSLAFLMATGGLTDDAWTLAVRIALHYRNTQAGQPPE